MTGTSEDRRSGDVDHELLAAFVGPNWSRHYRDSFAAIRSGAGSPRASFKFNWAAALAPFWLAYRGFWRLQLGSLTLFVVLAVFLLNPMAAFFAYVILGALQGGVCDRLLYRRGVAALVRARARGQDRDASLAAMRKDGGISWLLTALAAVIGLPVFGSQFLCACDYSGIKGKAYQAAMKSDLRNLVTAQESYFADSATYTRALTVDSMRSPYDSSWVPWPSTGVTVTIGAATEHGWSATARHAAIDSMICGIFVGTAPPPIRDAQEGEPKCEGRPRN